MTVKIVCWKAFISFYEKDLSVKKVSYKVTSNLQRFPLVHPGFSFQVFRFKMNLKLCLL